MSLRAAVTVLADFGVYRTSKRKAFKNRFEA